MPQTIIFSDIDGTMLDSRHRITPPTERAIRELGERGIPFVIVTARGITGTYPLLDEYGIRCPVVTYSGGVIMDEQRSVIHHHGLTRARAQEVADFIEEAQLDLTWSAFSFEDWVTPDKSDPRMRQEECIVRAQAREGSISSIERDEVQKIQGLCDAGQADEIEDALKERFPDLFIAKSSDTIIEIMTAGSTKALPVRILCELWDVDPADTIAFGDNYNDVPMLEAVGRGYLMANAPAELHERVALHAPSNDEDGVCQVLRKLGLVSA